MSNNSITWNGEDFSAYNLRVEDYNLPFMAQTIFTAHSTSGGDSQFTSINSLHRTITIDCYVSSDTESGLRDNMEAILERVNPVLGDKSFSIDKIPDRRYIGRVSAISTPSVKGMWGYTFTMTVQALSEAQDESETNTAQAIASDPDTLTFADIAGNVSRTPAEFYIRNETGGNLTSTAITLTNGTTNESIIWNGTLNDDQWLRIGEIDSDGRFSASIGLSDSTGADPEAESYTSAISGYTSGDWPRLKGGSDNAITVDGVSAGQLEITYRGRYI